MRPLQANDVKGVDLQDRHGPVNPNGVRAHSSVRLPAHERLGGSQLKPVGVIRRLGEIGALSPGAASDLEAGYDVLGRLDHQLRLIGDASAPQVQETLASAVGYESAKALEAELGEVRHRVRAVGDLLS